MEEFDFSIDLLALNKKDPARYPFLLESVATDPDTNRYDILFAFPQQNIQMATVGKVETNLENVSSINFLTALNDWFQSESLKEATSIELPFRGGWFLYLAYELAQEIEPVLNLPMNQTTQLPIAYACRIPAAIIVDKVKQKTWCLAENEYSQYLPMLNQDVSSNESIQQLNQIDISCHLKEEDPQRYLAAIQKIKKYIVEGDVFQVNLSRLWNIVLDQEISSSELYAKLRTSNPAPFSAFCCINDVAILSSSPERLISVKDNQINTRPIAGTRPRKRDAAGKIDSVADELLQEELLAHPKERAEHVMLIDLERNDLGRLAVPGSVQVNELMVLETYEHVHHIVSNVRAQLKPDVFPGDIIAATFPGGTITGCPKVRCMEIIAELEQAPREAYTGSLGYLNRNGDMDLNILIRTIVRSGKELHIRAGGGIVLDSIAEKELMETQAKAKGMLNAVK